MGWEENLASTGNIFGISNAGFSWPTTATSSTATSTSSGTGSTSGSGTYGMDDKTSGYYDNAHGYLDKAWNTLDGAKGYVSGLTDVANRTLGEWNAYKAEYDPVKKAALSLAGQEYGAKSGYLSKLQNVDNMSYDAEAGRAGATVAQQAELARQEQARALARQGVNAASGKSQALTQQGFLQEALAKAGVMTQARDTARDKNFSESLSAYNTIDPSKSVGSALAISSGANDLLGQYNGLMTQQASLANQNASTAGGLANTGVNLASSYGNTQLGYSKLNQQAASDAAQVGLGYYNAKNNYDIQDRETTLKENLYTDNKNAGYTSAADAARAQNQANIQSATSKMGSSSSGGSSKSSGGEWKPLGAGLYNTSTGEFKTAITGKVGGRAF